MGYKILLADDSVTVQKIITLTFSDEGVDVMTVNNGDEAIMRLHYMRPALVMADVSIPGKSGYQICEFVKNHPDLKDTPVILLVPAFEPFDEEAARRVGADHHLTKPFQSIRTLISTVKNLIEPWNKPDRSVEAREVVTTTDNEHYELEPSTSIETDVLDLSTDELDEQAASGDATEMLLEVKAIFPESETLAPESLAEDQAEIAVVERTEILTDNSLDQRGTKTGISTKTVVADDLDHVLELDDVLSDIWAPAITSSVGAEVVETSQAGFAVQAGEPTRGIEATSIPQNIDLRVPQEVIDEIVNRVVTQITETLVEKLSQDLARRVAIEAADIIKQQQLAEKLAYREPEPLLELDEV